MPAGGESSVDAWTAALAARLQLDSPHASRLPTDQPTNQPTLAPAAAPAAPPPPHAGARGAELLAQPAAAAAFPQAPPQGTTPQLAGRAHATPPRPPPAAAHTGCFSPRAGAGAGDRTGVAERAGERTGEAPPLAHVAQAPMQGLQQQRLQPQQAATPP